MLFPRFYLALLGLVSTVVHSYDSTDTLMDGDSLQSGYQPNHKMDPAIVTGGSFGQIWKYTTPASLLGLPEQFYARSLVYTPTSLGRQVLLSFSEQNRLYVLDAVNGSLIAFRDLALEGEAPFQVADLGSCNDISGTIGVTGTPVIDPSTDTVYFWAKSYMSSGQRGFANGAYRFHAVDAATLVEKPGFPTNIQGVMADNDHTRRFTGGTVLQRTSLNLVNKVVFAGFGGHCDQYNFTGWVVGMSPSTGQYLTGYVTSGGPNAPAQDGTFNGGGGGAGVWMAGMPIVSDNSGRIFFSTGNSYKTSFNQGQPASGRLHLDTLSECIVNLAVNSQTGQLTQQDYFEPNAYLAMDAGDRDLGSGGAILPDPGTFSGGGVARILIACGKNAICYVTNADDLGGYKLGPSGSDAILQTITPPSGGSMFTNPATYPLEGGYLYITPVGSPTYVYSLGFDVHGRPAFTLVAQTDEISSGRVGTGPAVITTNEGQAGTAVLWLMDPDAGPRAYHAVPVNGKMIKIKLPPTQLFAKFQRPIFGNGRYYVTSLSGVISAYGSPVALPLTCSSVDFGHVAIGAAKTLMVNCTANIAINQVTGLLIGSPLFQAKNSSLPQGGLSAGATFSFPVSFNLTRYILSAGSTSAPRVIPGIQSTSLDILTSNAVTGYSTDQPVSLTGSSTSAAAFLIISPLHAEFPYLVIGAASDAAGSSITFIISNAGQANLTILGYAFSVDTASTSNTNVTMAASGNGTYVLDAGGVFTSQDLPPVGTVLVSGQSLTVHATFSARDVGDHFTLLYVYADSGSNYIIFTGSADTAPIALLESSTSEGGWLTIPDCAIPFDGCTSQIDLGTSPGLTQLGVTIRFTNKGASNLVITKSKPPEGTVLGATNPNIDLSEGLAINPGASASATLFFSPGAAALNADPKVYSGTWTLNTNDLTFGVHILNFTGTLAAKQVGPVLSTGQAQFKYLGCYLDNVNGARIEQKEYVNMNNTNGLCQQQALAYNVPFAGVEYMSECWVGSAIPSFTFQVPDSKCTTYACSGDSTQLCGGAGGYMSLYYDTTKYFPNNGTLVSGYQPASSKPRVGAYQYAGCYSDSLGARSLSIAAAVASNTLENCAAACSGYMYFGTEYAIECYCGDRLAATSVLKPDTDCKMTCGGASSEICGAASRLSLYALNGTLVPTATNSTGSVSTTPSITATPYQFGNFSVGAYQYVDCHTDAKAARTLSTKSTQSGAMTVELCASYCKGFTYFGVEYSQECYCGNTLLSSSTVATDGRCSMPCAGSSVEICGGSSGLSLFQLVPSNNTQSTTTFGSASTSTASPTTSATLVGTVMPSVGAYSYVECRSDNTSVRTLQGSYLPTVDMTLERCAGNCTGYAYFGVEYSQECYCGNLLSYGSYTTTDGRCTMPCGGNPGEICGGSNGLTLYRLSSLSSGSPVSNSSTSSNLSSGASVSATSAGLSNSSISSYTSSGGGAAASSTGMSNSSGSYTPSITSNSISSVTSFTTTSSNTQASFSSNSSLDSSSSVVFTSTSSSQSFPSTTSTSITTTSTTSMTSPSSSVMPASNNSWAYVGCASDTVNARTLANATITNTTSMTIESCQNYCFAKNFPFAGLEFGSQCYCGMALINNSTTGLTGCTKTCAGNATEICGGSSRLSVYTCTSYIQPQIILSVAPYSLQGCVTDSTTARSLNSYTYTSSTSMTVEGCIAVCQKRGFAMAGLEGGGECFCGKKLASTSISRPLSDCKGSFCTGNPREYCGGPKSLLVYAAG